MSADSRAVGREGSTVDRRGTAFRFLRATPGYGPALAVELGVCVGF